MKFAAFFRAAAGAAALALCFVGAAPVQAQDQAQVVGTCGTPNGGALSVGNVAPLSQDTTGTLCTKGGSGGSGGGGSAQNLALGGAAGFFTFGTGTTAYNANQLLCSSTTPATCNSAIAAVYWTLPNGSSSLTGGNIRITDSTSTAWAANSQIQIDLFSAAPTMTNGDRGAWAISSGTAGWLASLICTTGAGEQNDGVNFNCTVVGGTKDINLGGTNVKVYGTYQAISASGVTAASANLYATLAGKY